MSSSLIIRQSDDGEYVLLRLIWLQASGLAVLCSGVWMQVEMHKYLVLNGEYSDVAPYILVATGSLILLISSLACCCTVKGHPTLLYVVNWISIWHFQNETLSLIDLR